MNRRAFMATTAAAPIGATVAVPVAAAAPSPNLDQVALSMAKNGIASAREAQKRIEKLECSLHLSGAAEAEVLEELSDVRRILLRAFTQCSHVPFYEATDPIGGQQ